MLLELCSWVCIFSVYTCGGFKACATKGTFGTLNENYDKNCNLYYKE